LREAREKLQRIRERLTSMEHPRRHATARVEIDVVIGASCDASVTLEYVVPGACWRPYHRAELEDGRLRFATDACVWQNTGEEWRHAQLVLSTERLSLGVEPPELLTDELRVQKRSESLVVEAREQTVETTGLGGAQKQVAAELPGIEDGGSALNIAAEGFFDVPSDGRPHRIPIASFEAEPELRLVSMPELSPCAMTAVAVENASDAPILAGPVDLVRNSGLVGKTRVLFVAPGERFEIGFGPESDLRVRRTQEASEEKSKLLSSWQVRKVATTIRLSNLGTAPREIVVKERIPVSELDKVRFEVDRERTTGGKGADENGFIEWVVNLPGRGHSKLELHYESKKHEDVQGM
jgi:uncharacterized protein (TIGR02231 family)